MRSTFFSFMPPGALSAPGEKFSTAFTPAADDLIQHRLRRFGRHGDYGDIDPFLADDALELADVVDGHAAPRLVADFGIGHVEERRDLEAFATKTGIVGQGQAEVAGAHHRDAEFSVKAQNLPEVALEILDVVSDAADAELAKIGQILADLCGVQVELLRQRLRGNGLDAVGFELCQAAQVNRQTIGGELGDLLSVGPALVR